jgi:uncharacterized protein YbjT (DUF2867 family)
MKRILVTGGTGNVGGELVKQLRATDCQIRVLSRNPQSAVLPADVEVVRGDLSAPETLDEGLKGVDAVFLVWVAPLAAAAPAVERIARDPKQIVLLTSPHRVQHPFFQQPNVLRAVHAGIEQLIEGSSLQWTFLRPGAFAMNARNWWASQIKNGDVVRWFYGGAATAPIHERDIAAVAVRALSEDGHSGKEYVLTGPESLTQREQVETIGRAIGRQLSFEELSPDAGRRELLTMMPPHIADMLLTAYGAAVDRPAYVTSTVGEITGTPAATFHRWAMDHAADFAPDKSTKS